MCFRWAGMGMTARRGSAACRALAGLGWRLTRSCGGPALHGERVILRCRGLKGRVGLLLSRLGASCEEPAPAIDWSDAMNVYSA